ncbi:uncharacterized protein MONOS_3958 [Monocercomonoides exilis]|uniref:uncharacterized protein n=1 Tax=Monocercomonoides exilis TaxID=2049356 RepID=UPI00355A692C|nr:hypothetical protein MONOS_3958 [Monocercomonoides exilis]|eukprot:MONOS_3958.1-p1 / transcript=MONOS_3958.1 / gene=MONOS_3958 / organism=Monocercomonoides_exilis_PA203 / gene_product=unspecified product / transcript_product=unspecified product / location=Mono_scaffold00099:11482-12110(+) / protein_length=156 / sequence_SO=supercontig / SO=protein_coding / is_pseudo=false
MSLNTSNELPLLVMEGTGDVKSLEERKEENKKEKETEFIFESGDPDSKKVEHEAYKYEYGEAALNVSGSWIWNKSSFTNSNLDIVTSNLDRKKKKFMEKYGTITSMKPDKSSCIDGSLRYDWNLVRGSRKQKAFITGIKKTVIKRRPSMIISSGM